MKSNWRNLCEQLSSYKELIEKTLELLPVNKQTGKIKKLLAREWEHLIGAVKDLDSFMDPVNPPEIRYPFSSERFKAMWMYYKNYLANNHQFLMSPWNENSRLTMLGRFSRNDEERAMQIIELLCANNYRNVICPSDRQLSGQESVLPEEKKINLSIGKIPDEV
jgi:hypothetical protein